MAVDRSQSNLNMTQQNEKELSARLDSIKQRISKTEQLVGLLPNSVMLVAVSKFVAAKVINSAINHGQLVFGESYVQEAKAKIAEINLAARDSLSEVNASKRAIFHFIGHLQRNKTKQALGLFELIESVDRFELAKELSDLAVKKGIKQKVLLQVNTSGESSKFGVEPELVKQFFEQVQNLPGIVVKGMMSIGSYYAPEERDSLRRSEFVLLRELRNNIERDFGIELPCLSMGMSHDFELAIEEGATIVRVGSAIFGERQNSINSNLDQY